MCGVDINRDHTYVHKTLVLAHLSEKKQTQVDSNNVKSYVNPNKSHLPKRNSKDKTKLTCGFAFALSSSASNVLFGIQTFQINRLLSHFLLFNLKHFILKNVHYFLLFGFVLFAFVLWCGHKQFVYE